MADSRRLLFSAAAVGNVSPILLKWFFQMRAEEKITLPGETWYGLVGWLVGTILLAATAALGVVYVWKERTAQRAFVLGLALPYVLSGLVSDISGGVRIPRAGAQQIGVQGGVGPSSGGVQQIDDSIILLSLVTLKVEVINRFADKEEVLAEAITRVYPANSEQPVAASSLGTYALPKGKYVVAATAPGFSPARQEIELVQPLRVRVFLVRRSPWEQFLYGVRSVVIPTPLPGPH